MSTQEPAKVSEALTWLRNVIAADPVLLATRHKIVQHAGQLTVEVVGSHFEARAWMSAINGIIRPSRIDARGVRHKLVIGRRVVVDVVDGPQISDERAGSAG
jgi:hypothetical protein